MGPVRAVGDDRRSDRAGTTRHTLVHDGLDRTYLLHTPDLSPPRGLVVALHGGTGTGLGAERLTGLSELADRSGFVVVYPDGVGRLWNDAVQRNRVAIPNDVDDVSFLGTLIEAVTDESGAPTGAVAITGISNGGHMANRFATERSQQVAVVAPVSATLDAAYAQAHTPAAPVSVLYAHGTTDPLRYFTGGGAPGGDTLGAEELVAWWATHNRCVGPAAEETMPSPVNDGMPVRKRSLAADDGTEIVFFAIEGGGHTWPGGLQYLPEQRIGRTSQNLDFSFELSAFLDRHRRA